MFITYAGMTTCGQSERYLVSLLWLQLLFTLSLRSRTLLLAHLQHNGRCCVVMVTNKHVLQLWLPLSARIHVNYVVHFAPTTLTLRT